MEKLIATENEIELSVQGERILEVNQLILNDGKLEIQVKTQGSIYNENAFVLIEASKLSLEDKFMQHEPTSNNENKIRELLIEAINSGLKDFYRPKCDPTFTKDGGICYMTGMEKGIFLYPAVDKCYSWWQKVAKEFKPERGSRLGTKTEYVAFLGVLIKKLIEDGWDVEDAWNAVCNDSTNLGHFFNSKNAKHQFETTGSREICGFYDLANTHKIVTGDERIRAFIVIPVYYNADGRFTPLAYIENVFYNQDRETILYNAVGWIILEN